MENYIVINGKKAELTEEQLRQLGIEVKSKNPFQRQEYRGTYFYIDGEAIEASYEEYSSIDEDFYNEANYCTDKNLMQQRAWFEMLSRLLWRYSMEHDGDKMCVNDHYAIYKAKDNFSVLHAGYGYLMPSFINRQTAQNAIEEIIKPFMKEHPDFKW